MKIVYSGLLLFVLISLVSCQSKQEKKMEEVEIQERPEVSLGDNSQVSLDWNGTYKGTIPCANCEGIETELTLNLDGTYLLKTHYLGRNDDLEQEMSGPFQWQNNGSTIVLENLEGMPGKYKVGENRIWHLDMNGEVITGDLADHYILIKQ